MDTADTSELLARGIALSRQGVMQPPDLPVPSPPTLAARDTPRPATPRQDPADAFFSWLATTLPATDAAAVVITHVLPGQLAFLAALDRTARVAAVLPKPWSVNQAELARTAAGYRCDLLDRALCADPAWLARYVAGCAGRHRVVLLDVGGYFAPALTGLCAALPGQVAGVVEDTENGHRRYEALQELPCAVYSVARSPLKEPEDCLAGEAIVFSAEALVRQLGCVLVGRRACVVGYGKVGAAIAAALRARHVLVDVVDADPVRQVHATTVGYGSASLEEALPHASLVFSATGSRALGMRHLPLLRAGAFLAGATSGDDEFDLGGLASPGSGYAREEAAPGVLRFRGGTGNEFLLLGEGNAVNFLHASAIGPAIHLVKAELAAAAGLLVAEEHPPGFHAVSADRRAAIATAWTSAFGRGFR